MASLGRSRWAAAILIAIAASQLVACKAGDELVNAPVVAVPDFTSEAPVATARYVSIAKGTISKSRITLDIAITDVNEPVTALVIKLHYPKEIARFSQCTEGTLFPQADKCYATETSTGSGEVFLARSVIGANQGVVVTGTKVAMHVEFIVFGKESGPIAFEATNLGGGDASAVLDVNGDPILMEWYAGTLIGR